MITKFGTSKIQENPRLCVEEATKNMKNPQLILYFSGEKNFQAYTALIHEKFPESLCMGCTSYRTWNHFGTQKDALNIIAIESGIKCAGNIIEKADNFSLLYADNVTESLNEIGDTKDTVCIEFTIPYKLGEEFALMALNSVLLRKEIPVIGGTATHTDANVRESEEAYIALNGKVYTKGCVFALIHNNEGSISLYQENIYKPLTNNEYFVTKANNLTRTIISLDDDTALNIYSKELGISPDDADKYFFHYPMGRRIGDDTYITAVSEKLPNGNMKFHARVQEGVKMMVMEEGDYKKITRDTINEIKTKTENPSLVLMFHCMARTMLFEENGYLDEYQELLSASFPNLVGFTCLGEQLGTKNFNHTMMMAVFD